MEVLVASVQHGAALKPLKSLEVPVEIVAVEIIYLHLQNGAKILPFCSKNSFSERTTFFLRNGVF